MPQQEHEKTTSGTIDLTALYTVVEKSDVSYPGKKRLTWRIRTTKEITKIEANMICEKLLSQDGKLYNENTFWFYFPESDTNWSADITIVK